MNISLEWTMQTQQIFDWTLFWRLTLAAVLGGVVGFERELNGHPAGLRTNILIATSSCLFTILSIHAFPLVGSAQDTARIAAQIVTGVGFLGAGTVIHTKGAVYGLTSGATIWMVAAVGMAVATDLYVLGIITTMLTTGVLVLLAPLSNWLATKAASRQEKYPETKEIKKLEE
ncbi:MAG: MgtC/SapB family protein [Ardenticatenaceae bacterium]|nr:MgtC/SapB family protein [Ardenticatenaceae bacterium]